MNAHAKIRQMLGHGPLDESEYEIQNIRDNVELMTPELLREAGRLIARTDAKLSRKSLARRRSGAATRSWWRRTSTIRPTSTCCGTRSAACFGRRRGSAAAPACPDGSNGGTTGAMSKRCIAGLLLLSENSPKVLKQNSPVWGLRIRSGGHAPRNESSPESHPIFLPKEARVG